MSTIMLLFKDIIYDARVKREAIALAKGGYKLTIFCVKEFDLETPDLHENIEIVRHDMFNKQIKMTLNQKHNDKAYTNVIKRMVRTPLLKLSKDIAAYRLFYTKTVAMLKEKDVTVIHAHDLNTLSIGYYLSKQFRAKLIYDSHELYNEMAGRNNFEKRIGYMVEGKMLKHIDHLIVVNPFVQEEFENRYGKKPTTIIENIPETNGGLTTEAENKNYFREKFKLAEEDIILLYQGGINPNRGIEECVEAVAQLPERFKFVILGFGTLTNELKELAVKLNLSSRVFFHEQVPSADILWYTKQADIGLVMYKSNSKNNYFSTPNKIYEYLLAGIPMVASDHPGKNFIINKYKIGLCIEEDVESIRKGILQLEKEYDMYAENCLINRKSISWTDEGNKLVTLYESLFKA
ncbi:glycosyltransferase [Alkalihalobacterium sp. APHAB7]|uniref:glycosyltransferase n=1 Tax=Alkalihalobacterium sp. APHAB7 TaxID=3402081 RepID=UPI003AACEB63